MIRRLFIILLIALCAPALFPPSADAARIKDIAQIDGVRNNQLIGYGLVVGLNGTGDSAGTKFTIQSLVNMLERLGIQVDMTQVKVNNVAAVMVTAELPPFAKPGTTIDVMVSSVGDSKNLSGGSLLMTPLNGPDGQVYAVAQGPLALGALAFGGKAASVQKNHPTVARIPGGALVERAVDFELDPTNGITYRLRQADFTTVTRMVSAINTRFSGPLAAAVDSATVQVQVPAVFHSQIVPFIASLETLEVHPDSIARIVVNEKTGTIVMGSEVRLSTVAVSHANLSLIISEAAQVSQPSPLALGQTVVVPTTDIGVEEEQSKLVVLNMGVSIGDVATALNAIGTSPRDLIAIFQAIKAAGALHAELVVL